MMAVVTLGNGGYEELRLEVLSIQHSELGALESVNTEAFGTYLFKTKDGRILEVEAEEDPGRCWTEGCSIRHWDVEAEVRLLPHPS